MLPLSDGQFGQSSICFLIVLNSDSFRLISRFFYEYLGVWVCADGHISIFHAIELNYS